MKKVIGFISILLIALTPLITQACMYIYEADKMDITIKNIDNDIESVWIYINELPGDAVNEIFDVDDFDFTDEFGGTLVTEVKPFEKEDFVFDKKYDEENYYVSYSISYSYDYENFGYGSSKKYKNVNELLKESHITGEEAKKMRSHPEKIVCTRFVSYIVDKLEKHSEVTSYDLKGKTMKIALDDLSMLEGMPVNNARTRLYLRLYDKHAGFKTIEIGGKTVSDSCDRDNPDEDIVLTYEIDYKTGKILNSKNNIRGDKELSNFLLILCPVIGVCLLVVICITIVLSHKKKST